MGEKVLLMKANSHRIPPGSHKSRVVNIMRVPERVNQGHLGRYSIGINKAIADEVFENFKDTLKECCYHKRTI